MRFLPSEDLPSGGQPVLEPIAICGMSSRTPGKVTCPSELWKMLLEKRSGSTNRVPKSRFNIDAHLHETLDRPGSFNVSGGYFLDGPAEAFDPTFFNMTPVEAMWLDPQQRRMLEVCYEAIESAGLTLDTLAGSNTGVFAASFTADYQQMLHKEHDFRHNYCATGVDTGLISARIGNIFDLRGPNFLLNTACSSSIYALHYACSSLRARDCDSAIVGGVNMILTVDQHMNTAKLGILSPTNFCHTFDESADGYGRAEGAGALYLKRLDDAIRDGDNVRAVIRSSAVSSNGKVPGAGITFPNVDGQEQVIRRAYNRAGLDPNETAVFEVHGTGTPVGDPIEARAVSRAMNDTRAKDKPLILTATKPNIGHSEAASGIFAVIKAVLMVETGLLPGVAGLKKVNPSIHESEWNIKVNKDLSEWPAGFSVRRASVSSFGYGGNNAHVVVENVGALVPGYRHGMPKAVADYDHATTRPLLVTMSAHDKTTLTRNMQAHAGVVDRFYLADFAHTLNTKRNTFSQRAYAVATETSAAQDLAPSNFKFGSGGPVRSLAFVFTGQGAQWASVGKEAMAQFPAFRSTIRRLDHVLRRLPEAPDFTLEAQLADPAESSRINHPDVAQCTLTAIQIAVVDLLDSWGVTPQATIGHSSGEVGAAYAAGLVSAPEAIVAVYYRGYAAAKYARKDGSMLAIGKGAEELESYYRDGRLDPAAIIACENSPASVTLSGPVEAIHAARDMFTSEKVFARELRTGMAYHSSYMQSAAGPMVSLIAKALEKLDDLDRQWRCPERRMMSTVTNKKLTRADISAEYWASNLVNTVRFNTGVTAMVDSFGPFDGFVEIGPHSALAGPLKQICKANGFSSLVYVPTVVRDDGNSAVSLLKTAGELYLASYPVDLAQVNEATGSLLLGGKARPIKPLSLCDLPPYQWNYDKVFWRDSRDSAEHRQLTHARHDLLGRRVLGLSDNNITWRNVLRIKDVPWLVDHKLGGSIMFPAAGHLAVAMEALRQYAEVTEPNRTMTGITVRDFDLMTALVVPETDEGVEMQVRLTAQLKTDCFSFAVESHTAAGWTVHSTGTVEPQDSVTLPASHPIPVDMAALTQRHSGKRWNEAFRRVGFEYGRSFATLDKIRTHGKYLHHAAGTLPLAVESGLIPGESRYLLHPSTVDGLMQLSIIAIHAGRWQEMPWGVVPVHYDEVTINFLRDAAPSLGQAVTWLPEEPGPHDRRFVVDGKIMTEDGTILVDIKGVHAVAYEAALPPVVESDAALSPMPYTSMAWRPDPKLNTLGSIVGPSHGAADAVLVLIDSLNHKQPLASVLLLDRQDSMQLEEARLLHVTKPAAALTLHQEKASSSTAHVRINRVADVLTLGSEQQDVVVLGHAEASDFLQGCLPENVKSVVDHAGTLVLVTARCDTSALEAGFEMVSLPDSSNAVVCYSPYKGRESTGTNGSCNSDTLSNASSTDTLTADLVYSPKHSSSPDMLAVALKAQGIEVQLRSLEDVDHSSLSHPMILYNPHGNLLSAPDASFDWLKKVVCSGAPVLWLTSGVNEGQCPAAAMVSGFLRVVRQEERMAKVAVLDYDKNETSSCIARTVESALREMGSKTAETELWLHEGVCLISRILPDEELNGRMMGCEGHQAEHELLPRGVLLRGCPESGEMVFRRSDDLEDVLGPREVEVQVTEMLEFNKLHRLNASQGPRLVAGTVTKVGAGGTSKVGARVLTYTTLPYDTLVRVPEDVTVSFQDKNMAYGLLGCLCRAVFSILGASESLAEKRLVLLCPSSALSKSVDLLAHEHSWQVRTALSSSDLHDIRNSGMLGDGYSLMVLAEEFSPLAEHVWAELPPGATFVLADRTVDVDVPKNLDARPLARGARFVCNSVGEALKHNRPLIKKTLRTALELTGPTDVDDEACTTTLSHLADGSSISGHVSVVKYQYEIDTIKMAPTAFSMRFSSEDVYLLVGCLGGLGRSLTSWMMDRGAKQFAFVSRSGDDKPEAARLVKAIRDAGAMAQVFRGDAANVADMSGVVDVITKTHRIRGVVHAAMVLNDSLLPSMTVDKWKATLSPKVDGAMGLAEALREHEDGLDFFVMTSSISGMAGQPGQSNYAAANAYLDNLALARSLAGRPATSLVLPMVLGVGVVAENDGLEAVISRRGLYGVDEQEMLRGFAAAMSQPSSSSPVIIMGLQPERLAVSFGGKTASDATWLDDDARFNGLRAFMRSARGLRGSADSSSQVDAFVPRVQAVADNEGYDAALDMMTKHVMAKCAAILLIPVDAMEPDGPRSVGAHGLDSMIGTEMRNWLFRELTLSVPIQDLLASTLTFRGLADLALGGLGVKPEGDE